MIGVAKKGAATNARNFRNFLLMQQFAAQEIGVRIAQARREADGMTQETLGDLIGVSKRQVQNYEAGSTIPWKQMREIAKITGKEVDWFLHGDQVEREPAPRVPEEEVPAVLLRATADGVAEILERLGRIEKHLGLDEAESA